MSLTIQTNITGFSGAPASLYSMFDKDTGVLVIAAHTALNTVKREGCLVVSNDISISRDTLFELEHLANALKNYIRLKNSKAKNGIESALVFTDKSRNADPSSVVETDGIDANGYKFRLTSDITNAQMATLATCWQVSRFGNADSAIKIMHDTLYDERFKEYVML
jgi:hypothetical protein